MTRRRLVDRRHSGIAQAFPLVESSRASLLAGGSLALYSTHFRESIRVRLRVCLLNSGASWDSVGNVTVQRVRTRDGSGETQGRLCQTPRQIGTSARHAPWLRLRALSAITMNPIRWRGSNTRRRVQDPRATCGGLKQIGTSRKKIVFLLSFFFCEYVLVSTTFNH
jgi:hypothetical protein